MTAGPPTCGFVLDGAPVEVPANGTLLDALREHLGVSSAKDGCSPQGQCGCCTVWVDGKPRVACVTPVTRVANRAVTTVDGLDGAEAWAERFADAGASQCGFCTPGIIMRVAALTDAERSAPDAVRRALLAHLCRCTGWQPIVEAVVGEPQPVNPAGSERAVRRAAVEGGVAQDLGPHVALGRGGFADDDAPAGALVAIRKQQLDSRSDVADGQVDGQVDGWVVAPTLAEARAASGKVQGRRTTAPVTWPLELPPGEWARTLRTTWVEPAYLEPDAAWCEPGGEPATPLGNGGAFGGKVASSVAAAARALADHHGRPVRALWTREDVVRFGPKRPPVAIGLRADGTGVIRIARTPGVAAAVEAYAPGIHVEEVELGGLATSGALRGAGWAEVAVVRAALVDGPDVVVSPSGARATAHLDADGAVHVSVRCGVDPADAGEAAVLRSYCIGAAHMALGWVRSEAIAVGDDGEPLDLTIRSFGVLRAVDVPPIHVEIDPSPVDPAAAGPVPVNGSDAVFAAVAAAAWRHAGHVPRWPVARAADLRLPSAR